MEGRERESDVGRAREVGEKGRERKYERIDLRERRREERKKKYIEREGE